MPKRKSNDGFIKDCVSVHGDKYDYSLVDYKNSKSKIDIICNDHGVFSQIPSSHLSGKGCMKCHRDNFIHPNKRTLESFIKEAEEVHKGKYNYSKSLYKNTNKKINIICTKHGIFKQTPYNHINRKCGCPKCGVDKVKNFNVKNNSGWTSSDWELAANKSNQFDSYKVYLIKCWNNDELFFKVGRTFRSIKNRFGRGFNNSMPYRYEVVDLFIFDTADKCFRVEAALKKLLNLHSYTPTKKFSGYKECFKLNCI